MQLRLTKPFTRGDLVHRDKSTYIVLKCFWVGVWWVKLTYPLNALVPYILTCSASKCAMKESFMDFTKRQFESAINN